MSRLIELSVSGFQKIRAVRIRPDGHLVTIAGRNDQGKTSLLQSIWVLLAGLSEAPPEMIRAGQEQCKLFGDFGELRITRTFSRKGDDKEMTHDLKVTEADGKPIRTKPQAAIDKLLGAYSFNPLQWATAKPAEQYDALKKLVIGFDFDANAKARQDAFDARTDVNRRLKEKQGALSAIQLPPGSCPPAVDVSAEMKKIEEANAANTARTAEFNERQRIQSVIATTKARVAEKTADIERLEKQLAEAMRARDELNAYATGLHDDLSKRPALSDEVDTATPKAKIAEAQKVAATREKFTRRGDLEDEIEALESEAAKLSKAVEDADTTKTEAIAKAKLPVEGLGFGDGFITLNGIPFSQAGTRVKILTSAVIAMSLNPSLRIMTIDQGSEIDKEGLAALEQLATDRDYTVIIAKVDEKGANGFIMEDGELKPTSEAAE